MSIRFSLITQLFESVFQRGATLLETFRTDVA